MSDETPTSAAQNEPQGLPDRRTTMRGFGPSGTPSDDPWRHEHLVNADRHLTQIERTAGLFSALGTALSLAAWLLRSLRRR